MSFVDKGYRSNSSCGSWVKLTRFICGLRGTCGFCLMGGGGGGCCGRVGETGAGVGASTGVPSLLGVGGGVGAGGGVFTFCCVNTASGEGGATCKLDD